MKTGWAAILGLACCCAHGAERVLDFHSEIRIAADGALAVTELVTVQAAASEQTHRSAYRAARQVRFLGDHDELAWTVNGKHRRLPIERMSAEVRFEQPIPAGHLQVDARTGAGRRNYQAFVRHGSAAFRITQPLEAGETFAITVRFPKGVVAPPTRAQRFDAWAESHPAIFAGLGGLLLCGLWFQARIRSQRRNSS